MLWYVRTIIFSDLPLLKSSRLSRRPEWQRSREFETTTSSASPGQYGYRGENSFGEDDGEEEDAAGKARVRVVFQPTMDTTHTIFYRGHWLRVKRGRKGHYSGYDTLSIRYVFCFLGLICFRHRCRRHNSPSPRSLDPCLHPVLACQPTAD